MADYAYSADEVGRAMAAAQAGWQATLGSRDASGKTYLQGLADAANALADADASSLMGAKAAGGAGAGADAGAGSLQDRVYGLLDAYLQVFNPTQMATFSGAWGAQVGYGVPNDYAQSAHNFFRARLALFYGLDALTRPGAGQGALPGGFDAYAQGFADQLDASAPLFTDAAEWSLVDAALRFADPLYATAAGQAAATTPAARARAFANYVLAFGFNAYSGVYLMNLLPQTAAATQHSTFTIGARSGITELQGQQIPYTYAVDAEPIVDWRVIVAVMTVVACALFVGVGFVYRWQDIR